MEAPVIGLEPIFPVIARVDATELVIPAFVRITKFIAVPRSTFVGPKAPETVKVAVLVIRPKVAVIVETPAEAPLATPVAKIVATGRLLEVQATVLVMLTMLASE